MINSTDTQRDSWKINWGFTLSCIGSAVGVGNIWMFPARVSKYGGGTFLLPHFLLVIMIGLSGAIGKMAFNRAARSEPISAFDRAMVSRGKGRRLRGTIEYIPVLGFLSLATGYSVVVGWILRYNAGSLIGTTLAPDDVDSFTLAFSSMAGSFGSNFWQTVGLVITFIIVILGISGGVKKINRIIMPLLFLLFLGLTVYMAFQPSAADGYRYIFQADLKGLTDPMTQVLTPKQASFSLSLTGNGTLIYGSYLDDRGDVTNAAWKITLFDTLAALLAALVIIPVMAVAGSGLDEGGPRLIFTYLPNLLKSMPRGHVLVVMFFTVVLFAGISSPINLFEAPIAALQWQSKPSRRTSVPVIAAAALAIGLCIQGIISGWMDFVSIYICPLGTGLTGIIFFQVFGSDYARKGVGRGRLCLIGPQFSFITSYLFYSLTAMVFVLEVVFGGIGQYNYINDTCDSLSFAN